MLRTTGIGGVLLALLPIGGCSGSPSATPPAPTWTTGETTMRFVAVSAEVLAACRSTARAVGYPVPCPSRAPAGLIENGRPGPTSCALHVIGPGGIGGCAKEWRGWVVGSSDAGGQHLVITASPRRLSYVKLVNGPAWYPKARVRPLWWTTVGGTRMRAVFVPRATNDGSAFADHVVLIWTIGEHTYGVGFHNADGLRRTLLLDEALAQHIKLVRP